MKTNVGDLKRGGILIANVDEFETSNFDKAGYISNPLDDPALLAKYDVHQVSMTRLTRDAVEGLGLTTKEAGRCKNFFSLGLVYWLFDRDPADHSVDQGQVQEDTEAWRRQPQGFAGRHNVRRSDRGVRHSFSGCQGEASLRQISQDHGQRSDRVGPRDGGETGR